MAKIVGSTEGNHHISIWNPPGYPSAKTLSHNSIAVRIVLRRNPSPTNTIALCFCAGPFCHPFPKYILYFGNAGSLSNTITKECDFLIY